MKYFVSCTGSKHTWESVASARSARLGRFAGELKLLYMFFEDELKEDIERVATIQGRSMQRRLNSNNSRKMDGEDSVYAIATFQEVCEEENWAWSQRILGIALSEVETALQPISRHDLDCDINIDNRKENLAEYTMELNVPEEFDDNTFVKLMREVHDYMISRVLYEWALLNYIEFAEIWERRMNMAMDKIRGVSKLVACMDARLEPSWVP